MDQAFAEFPHCAGSWDAMVNKTARYLPSWSIRLVTTPVTREYRVLGVCRGGAPAWIWELISVTMRAHLLDSEVPTNTQNHIALHNYLVLRLVKINKKMDFI